MFTSGGDLPRPEGFADGTSGLSTGAIVFIVIASILFIILLILSFYIYKRCGFWVSFIFLNVSGFITASIADPKQLNNDNLSKMGYYVVIVNSLPVILFASYLYMTSNKANKTNNSMKGGYWRS